ncbi:hypothetical protein AWENTII_006778 [Aspergillus wentii]
MFTVANGLILLWVFTLWWGERTVFQDSFETCLWESWEKWPQGATPHHVAFIADPQLVDPHTYPGRPWPLSSLTVKYTDQYMRRSFSKIQQNLAPDSVLFLGDLFDGGREWATRTTSSPEDQYKKYQDSFWKKEFHRFAKIFSNQWNEGDSHSVEPRGRRMIASLPGNHDLGFGSGIQIPVRDRFQSFFGDGNRVDVIGNHSFVSVDTVSLSAMDQPDPKTGSTGAGSGDGQRPNEQIWKDAENFLNTMKEHRGKSEMEALRMLQNQSQGHFLFQHRVADIHEPSLYYKPEPQIIGFPTILLSHVPLYRKAATPCGPYREHYPPSSADEELEQDEPNALKISGGYQYQNVLTQAISNDLVTKAGPNLVHIYSGDDHDYCEISHREFNGSPKEITVKSLSWAMGVRRPGFVLTSLWNPIDPTTGQSLQQTGFGDTVQNHLCLLPDQLSIFIYYGLILGLSLVALFMHSIVITIYFPEQTTTSPILPLSENRSEYPMTSHPTTSSTSSSKHRSPDGLASRGSNGPSRSPPAKGYYEPYLEDDNLDTSKWKSSRSRTGESLSVTHRIARAFTDDVKYVAMVVLAWYFFLILRW